MNGNNNNTQSKDIRFITSEYRELFRVPDGGYITITLENSEQLIRKCKYQGSHHVEVGNNVYHICQFAEIMEQNGNTYERLFQIYLIQ